MHPATHHCGQRRHQTACLSADIPHGDTQRGKLIGCQRHPDFRYIGTKDASQHLAGIHVLSEISSLTLNPTIEGQTDLRALEVCLGQRKCGFGRLQRGLSSRHLRLLQG